MTKKVFCDQIRNSLHVTYVQSCSGETHHFPAASQMLYARKWQIQRMCRGTTWPLLSQCWWSCMMCHGVLPLHCTHKCRQDTYQWAEGPLPDAVQTTFIQPSFAQRSFAQQIASSSSLETHKYSKYLWSIVDLAFHPKQSKGSMPFGLINWSTGSKNFASYATIITLWF